ncbi:hypothetical protein [Streptomyces sp. CT34]|uniref:hypothetical protein n=1 Tax=Streptomyces sp. CT34 TaxID=1553907 RepID=UPI0005BAA396|nr:hypothetical protein [Streptomyces sp. CT34]
MSGPQDSEPTFFVLDYVTITRDPKTQLVVAIGGDERAEGILQTAGGFVSAAGPRGPYQHQPHTMPVEQQRQGATAAAHALLLAGFSVHLDSTLNVLATADGDQQAAHRSLQRLAERARNAADDQEVAKVLTEIAAPHDGLLPRMVQTLISTWAPWAERLENAGHEPDPAQRLMTATNSLSNHALQIELIRNQAARTTSAPALTTAPAPPLSKSPALRR